MDPELSSESGVSLMQQAQLLLESAEDRQNAETLRNLFGHLQGLEDDLSAETTKDESSKGKKIKPSQGFCIKTADTEGNKMFINVCRSSEMPSPQYKSEDELIEILQSESDSGYRVPMSLAEPRAEKDKSGKSCSVYDVIINDDFCSLLENNEILRSIIVSVIFMGIEDKYKVSLLAESAIVLKNKKYMGTFVKERWVQDRPKAPLITEIERHAKVPEYTLCKKCPSPNVEQIIGEFTLNGIMNIQDIALDLGEDRIVLNADDRYHLDIFIPYDIVQDDARAHFDIHKQVLLVTMPVFQQKT